MQVYLTGFIKENAPSDYAEKFGNFGLGLLRIGCGKILQVRKDSYFKEIQYSKRQKIIALALAILTLPLAICATVSVHISKTHLDTRRAILWTNYHQFRVDRSRKHLFTTCFSSKQTPHTLFSLDLATCKDLRKIDTSSLNRTYENRRHNRKAWLPSDVFQAHILPHLSLRDKNALAQSCRMWNKEVQKDLPKALMEQRRKILSLAGKWSLLSTDNINKWIHLRLELLDAFEQCTPHQITQIVNDPDLTPPMRSILKRAHGSFRFSKFNRNFFKDLINTQCFIPLLDRAWLSNFLIELPRKDPLPTYWARTPTFRDLFSDIVNYLGVTNRISGLFSMQKASSSSKV